MDKLKAVFEVAFKIAVIGFIVIQVGVNMSQQRLNGLLIQAYKQIAASR